MCQLLLVKVTLKKHNDAYSATFLQINRQMSFVDTKRDLPKRTGLFHYIREFNYSSTAACAAATRAIGTRNGEHDT